MRKNASWLAKACLILFCVSFVTFALVRLFRPEHAETAVSYASFRKHVTDGDLLRVRIENERLVGSRVDADAPPVVATYRQTEGDDLLWLLDEYGMDYEYVAETNYSQWLVNVLVTLLVTVVAFLLGFMVYVDFRKRPDGSALVAKTPSVRFSDVAGAEEAKAELQDVVAYLRSPDTFSRVGARPPRGVLLHGPPGTGKTLLARAVAGEANVPFFHVVGSDFVERYVGTGAARVRELFAQARAKAPCILLGPLQKSSTAPHRPDPHQTHSRFLNDICISPRNRSCVWHESDSMWPRTGLLQRSLFIDEVDAVGTRRADSAEGGDREHAQTLNAVLACIDGFSNDPKAPPVVLIAATNRPEMLDVAFVRPGRFDRQVVVGLPGPEARKEMFAVHVKSIVLSPSVDIGHVAELASGMSGAQIANVVNEAARAATRRDADAVEEMDFREAFDVIQIGGKSTDRIPSPDERRRTAVHESAHAILARAGGIPVRRVTILPRGQALGANILGGQDTPPTMPNEVRARIAMLLAGYAGEELVLGKPSLGSAQDVLEANRLLSVLFSAGYSTVYPLAAIDEQESRRWNTLMDERSKTLQKLLAHAKLVLENHRPLLDDLTELLLRKETLLREELDQRLSPVESQTPSF